MDSDLKGWRCVCVCVCWENEWESSIAIRLNKTEAQLNLMCCLQAVALWDTERRTVSVLVTCREINTRWTKGFASASILGIYR